MKHGSLFSGIGGFDLAAEWMGWTNVFHCEYNPFGQRVLKHYWPNSISYGDIKQTDFTIHRGEIDVLSGGFPCQPFSSAGKRKGTEDDRHLWPEMLRAIREIQPTYVVGENVRGFTNWNGGMVFDQVQADLEAEGYEVLPFLLPACAVNAPHRRDRIWIVAHRTSDGLEGRAERQAGGVQFAERSKQATENTDQDGRGGIKREEESKERGLRDVGTGDNERLRADNEDVGTIAHAPSMGRQRWRGNKDRSREEEAEHIQRISKGFGKEWTAADATRFIKPTWESFPTTEPTIRQRNDGISSGLSGITVSRHRKESIMAYGNAIVPQVAFEIFKVINALSKNPQ